MLNLAENPINIPTCGNFFIVLPQIIVWTMQIIFDDKDLEELIMTGRNSKYKKYTRNKKFMTALATAYLSLDNTHYGNKKWEPCTFYGSSSRDDD